MFYSDKDTEKLKADIRKSLIKKQILVISLATFGAVLLGYTTHWAAPIAVIIMMWSNNIDKGP